MKPELETVGAILKRKLKQNEVTEKEKSKTENSKEIKKPKHRISLIEKRQIEQKNKIIEEIRNVYIPSVACQKTGISRATLYRWFGDDSEFRKEFMKSQMEGRGVINDLAESKLIGKIKNDDTKAMMFWLTHMHPNFISPLTSIAEETRNIGLTLQQKIGIEKRLAQWMNINSH